VLYVFFFPHEPCYRLLLTNHDASYIPDLIADSTIR